MRRLYETVRSRQFMTGVLFVLALLIIGVAYWRIVICERTIHAGTVVGSTGLYRILPANVKMCVWVEDGILAYEVRESTGRLLIRSRQRASAYSQWRLMWDESNNLWTLSSDIGNSVWMLAADNNYAETYLRGERDWYEKMPRQLLKYVPSSALGYIMRSPVSSGTQSIILDAPLGR